jgi:hypothetical protein
VGLTPLNILPEKALAVIPFKPADWMHGPGFKKLGFQCIRRDG